MQYLVLVEKGPSSFGAYVPDLPGCIAVGESREEALQLIQEAIEFHIDEGADALRLRLVDTHVVESEETAPGIIMDYDAENQVVGIEVLYLSKRPQPMDIKNWIEAGLDPTNN